MNAVCRYCRRKSYPVPEVSGTLSLDYWKGEWAHIMCYAEVSEWTTKLLVEMTLKIQHATMVRKAMRSAIDDHTRP